MNEGLVLKLQKKEIENHYKQWLAFGKSKEVAVGLTALDTGLNRRDVEIIVMEENL